MLIKKLILSGFKRLFLNHIEHLEYTPNTNVSILISGNGGGKTSTLNMLNPLPADIKKDFKENGYKYIEIEHRGKEYKLSSGLIPNKHSFICNDVELNPGGTRKVQTELAYEHFKIDIDINNIIVGTAMFTSMSIPDRKHWFSELSTIDYSFPIKVYTKLKQRHRDILGGIKLVQEEMIKAETSILSEEAIEKLKTDRDMLEAYITHCLSIYNHSVNIHTENNTYSIISNINNELRKVMNSLTLERKLPSLIKDIAKYTERKINLEKSISSLNKDLLALDKISHHNESLEGLLKRQSDINESMSTMRKDCPLTINLDSINKIIESYNYDYSDMVSLINSLADYKEFDSSKKSIEDITSIKVMIEGKIRSSKLLYDNTILQIDTMIKNKTDDNRIVCSNCNHTWYHHYDEAKLKDLKASSKIYESKIEEDTKEYNKIIKLLENIVVKSSIVEQIKLLTLSRPELMNVWSYIFSKYNIHKDSPTLFLSSIEHTKALLLEVSSYENLNNELLDINNKIIVSKEIHELKSQIAHTQISTLEKDLSSNTIEYNKISSLLISYSKERDNLIRLEELQGRLKTLLRKSRLDVDSLIAIERNKLLMELVNELKSQMVIISQSISNSQQLNYKVESNKKLLEDYKSKEKVLNLLLKELSPTEGIIAKSINSFLNVFIKEMNHIINSVWSYSMELLPCELSNDNDLDYKFRVRVNKSETIEDISKLSSSMQEIVNLAFKIVFVKYLGIPDTPLILDEFGRTMDPTHRINAYNVIDRVLSSNFSQIFIVSHFESMYGRFGNADISVLDQNNLELNPDIVYNKVLKINHK